MNGVGVFLGPILDGAAGNAVNLKRSEKLPQGGSIPPKENKIRGPRPAVAGWGNTTTPWMIYGISRSRWQAGEGTGSLPVRWSGAAVKNTVRTGPVKWREEIEMVHAEKSGSAAA